MKKFLKVIFFVFLGLFIIGLVMQGFEEEVKREMQSVENQVAADSEREYEIAVKNGSPMDCYVAAGMVKAAYLQANDEKNYKKWHKIESQWASKIGL